MKKNGNLKKKVDDDTMEDLELLLSDQFADFAKKITEVSEQRKQKKMEFKKAYDAFQKEIKDLDDQAKKLQLEWEQWKKERTRSVGDG